MAVRGTYYGRYLKRIINTYPLARTFLESGMLVEIKYKPPKDKKKPMKTYVGILLHKGSIARSTGVSKLHFITIEDMQPRHFDLFVDDVGLEPSRYFEKVRKLKLEKLLTEQKTAEKFYISKIRDELDGIFKNSYRTFLLMGISSIKVIDFDFK